MATTGTTRQASARSVGCGGIPCARSAARSCAAPRSFRAFAAAAIAAVASAASPVTDAQTWHIVPAFALESTLTDNVNLVPAEQRKSDWVNQFTPSVRFSEIGAHSKLAGSLSLPMLVYTRTSENDYIAPEASVTGTFEAVERLFFVDASANVTQQYVSPFGARSVALANATQNRYTAQAYTISPYIKGSAGDGVSYQLRQQSVWSDATGLSAGTSTNRSYTSGVDGNITREARPGGASVEYSRSDIRFPDVTNTGGDSESTEIGRLRGLYRVDPALQLSASAGYEDNRFFSTRQNGATYGAGIVWHPTDRTNLNATWERRFFGASYHVAFDHRTPLSVWSLNASRDITSYPQQIANLPGGADVNVLLNSLFASRAQDAAQRQLLVDELIRDRGLPLQLSGPLAIFAQQLTLVEAYTATFGILGARNAILFTAYHSRNEPVEGAEAAVSPLLALLSNTTQSGINVAWSHTLAPKLTFVLNGGVSRATDNTGTVGSTRLYALNATLSQSLSALTSAFVGARYQRSLSDQGIGTSYSELAAFVGLTHIFH